MHATTVFVQLAAVCLGVAAARVGWADDKPTPAAVAAALPFDDRLLRLMNEHFCQETPLLDVAVYDALPEAWPAADRERLPAANPQRRMAIGRYYGLTPPPEGVQEFPLGFVPEVRDDQTVLRTNCLICHSGEVFGQAVVGIGNNRLDFEFLMDDAVAVSKARGLKPTPLELLHVTARRHGIRFNKTAGSTAPLTFAALFMSIRNPDMSHRRSIESLVSGVEAPLAASLARSLGANGVVRSIAMFGMLDVDQDAPSWWLARADDRIFIDSLVLKEGRATIMFLADPWTEQEAIARKLPAGDAFVAHLDEMPLPATYADVFPSRVDRDQAAVGRTLFVRHCAECHGTYGDDPADDDYPGRVVPVEEIGTDPGRARVITPRFRDFVAKSRYASPGTVRGVDEPEGYRAPYLRRVAYTFPYFHNGSVPTLRHVLFPDERPARWIIDPDHFDHARMGQQVTDLPAADTPASVRGRRTIFDTTLPGKGNQGHESMLAPLKPSERLDVLEYLKTL